MRSTAVYVSRCPSCGQRVRTRVVDGLVIDGGAQPAESFFSLPRDPTPSPAEIANRLCDDCRKVAR